MLSAHDNECVGVIADSEDQGSVGMSLGLMRNISDKGSLMAMTEAQIKMIEGSVKKKWLISLVGTPSLRPEWLSKNAGPGEYYLFAEHDDLTSFIGDNSPFNFDSFRRKGPWDTYKPIMNSTLIVESRKDVLYCSNIGCTLKKDLISYPLVWDYTEFGVPILLAKGVLDKGRRFVFIGDSDPSANFLAPYNSFWLRAVLGIPNYSYIANTVLLMILVFFIMWDIKTVWKIIAFACLAFFFYLVSDFRADFTPTVDVSISSTGKWRSPHYISHFSSLPKKLAEENLIVSIERKKVNSKIDIKIITDKRYSISNIKNPSKKRLELLVLLPGASIVAPNRSTIVADEIPLGRKEVILPGGKKIFVEDARELIVNGEKSTGMVLLENNSYIIATGSPQRLGNLNDLISR